MSGLSIILVNYRSAHLIRACIQSVFQFNKHGSFEIIIVDNDTVISDELKSVLEAYPEVQRIPMNENTGFARANNEGMRLAKSEVFLLLNPDTLAVDDSIERCFLRLKDSSYIAAGVQQMDAEGRKMISGNYFVKGGLNHLLPIPYWGALIRSIGYGANVRVPNVREAKPTQEVDWISGAFLMVKREAVASAGLMDEDFFLYAEEVEWCSRLKKTGPLCIFGDLHIIHLEGGIINEQQGIHEKGYYNLTDKKGLQLIVSNHLRVRKQYGVGWFLFLLLNYTWGVLVYFAASFFHRLFTLRNPFGDWDRAFKFGTNVAKLWGLSPKIISNKPHFYKMF